MRGKIRSIRRLLSYTKMAPLASVVAVSPMLADEVTTPPLPPEFWNLLYQWILILLKWLFSWIPGLFG